VGRFPHRGRLDPAGKEPFYDGSQQLFFGSESPKQRHFAESGFDGNFAGSGAF
jgi:hypothetical protein